jgi:hypothetical protein
MDTKKARDRVPSWFAPFGWQFSPAAVAGIVMPTKPTIIELDMDRLEEILRRVEAQDLHADDYEATNSNTGPCIVRVQGTLRQLSSSPPSEGKQARGTDAKENEGGGFGDGRCCTRALVVVREHSVEVGPVVRHRRIRNHDHHRR